MIRRDAFKINRGDNIQEKFMSIVSSKEFTEIKELADKMYTVRGKDAYDQLSLEFTIAINNLLKGYSILERGHLENRIRQYLYENKREQLYPTPKRGTSVGKSR